ncbi:MAG TPA: STAS domain-containing protein [Gaiellales bacterium]
MNAIVAERAEPGVEVVTVTGEHDLSTAPELKRQLDAALASGAAVVVDLMQTTFIDSTVLRVLILAREDAGERGIAFRVALGESTGYGVRRLLELTGMEQRLATAPTRAAAIADAAAL